MGILLDETATEDDYVAPEYDVLAKAWNYVNEPIASFPQSNPIVDTSVG